MVKAVQNSHKLYSQHIREQQRKKTKEKEEQAEADKRTLDDMKQEEKRLHEKLEQLTSALKRPCKEQKYMWKEVEQRLRMH